MNKQKDSEFKNSTKNYKKDLHALTTRSMATEPQDMEKSNFMWNQRAEEFSGIKVNAEAFNIIDLFRSYGNLDGATILDAGCGAGRYLPSLYKTGAKVEGLDPSSEMIKFARKLLKEEGIGEEEVILHNQSFQDFNSKDYDYIFISNSPIIAHYENYKKLLSMAKKGLFILSWMDRSESAIDMVAKELHVENFNKHKKEDGIIKIFNLLYSEGYLPRFMPLIEEKDHSIPMDSLLIRYCHWCYGSNFTEKEKNQMESALKKIANEHGCIQNHSRNILGVLYVEVEESKRVL